MSEADVWLLAAALVGTLNAVLLAGLWLTRPMQTVLPRFWPFPALLLLGGAVTLLIGADHAGSGSLKALEWVLTAASGPLLLDAVLRGSGRASLPAWAYLAVPLALVLVLGVFGTDGSSPDVPLVLMQWTWTAIAAFPALTPRPAAPAHRATLVLVGLFGAVHLCQLVRMVAPDPFRSLVPLALGVGFLLLTAVLLYRGRALGGDFRHVSSEAADDREAGLADLVRWLEEEGGCCTYSLTLSDAAAHLGRPEAQLARWLADHGDTFQAQLTRSRLATARMLLRDPGEARTSIEAIGLMSGFRSRSGFYKAFVRDAGMTPAEYRRRG